MVSNEKAGNFTDIDDLLEVILNNDMDEYNALLNEDDEVETNDKVDDSIDNANIEKISKKEMIQPKKIPIKLNKTVSPQQPISGVQTTTNTAQKPITMQKSPILLAKKKEKPTVFLSSFDDTWQELIDTPIENKVVRKGIIIILGGGTGDGKTHLACDFVNVPEINIGYRIIPQGEPVYIICVDNSPLDEVNRNYRQQYADRKIIIANCYVKDGRTGRIDPIATLAKMNKYLSALQSIQYGTIVIEDWTKYCQFVLYAYISLSAGSGSKGYSFDEFQKPERPLSPTEYQYKAKVIDEVLLSFQNDYTANIVLVVNLKEEVQKTGSTVYDIVKTDNWLEDMQKGSDRMADVIVRLWRETINNQSIRHLTFKKSRFEGEIIDINKVVVQRPTATKLIKAIIQLYLKQGK